MANETITIDIDSFDVLNVAVKLRNGQVKQFDVAEELSISKATLNEDFIEQAGKYAWWSVLAEIAKSYVESTKNAMEKAEAEADKRARTQLQLDGIKITETAVDRAIKLDEEYQAAVNAHLSAKKNAAILEKIARAFEQRKEMLINLGANLRNELDGSSDVTSSLKERARLVTKRD